MTGRSSGTWIRQNAPRPGAAVDLGRVDEVLRDALQPGQEDQRAEADPAPDRHDHDGVQRLVRRGEEAERGQAELAQRRR